MIYKDKEKINPGPMPSMKLFLNLDNFKTGITFAWNVYRSSGTQFETKLEAETAAMHFAARYPEFLNRLKVTWTKKRIPR